MFDLLSEGDRVNCSVGVWKRRRLHEIAAFKSGGTPPKENRAFWGGLHPWISPKDVKSDFISESLDHITDTAVEHGYELLNPNTIVAVVRSGILARTFPVALTTANLAINQDIKAIEVDPKVCSPHYVLRYLQSLERQVIRFGVKRGATVHSVRSGFLEDLEIVFPEDKDAQEIIAEQLALRLALARRCSLLLERENSWAAELRGTLLREVFDSERSHTWRPRRLDDFAKTCSGTTPDRARPDYYGGSIPWIKTAELKDGLITTAEECVTDRALEETTLRRLPPETLLVAMYGQGATRGRTGLLAIEATINQACFAVLPDRHVFDPRFLQYWFMHNYKRLRRLSHRRGGNQPNLNGDILRSQVIAMPDDPAEQSEIVALIERRLQQATRIVEVARRQVKLCQSLPTAILSTIVPDIHTVS